MKDVYFAKDAKLINIASNEGCLKEMTEGSSVTFTVEAEEAEYALSLYYSNGTGDGRILSVSLNGAEEKEISLPVTPNRYTLSEKIISLPLAKGQNTVTFVCDGGNGGVCLDRLCLAKIYQAEKSALSGNAEVQNEHKGFLGEGYVPFFNEGNRVDFTVNTAVEGAHTLAFRYSADQDNCEGRSFSLSVNGGESERMFLNPTRNHEIWGVYRHTVSLKKGENKITLLRDKSDNGDFNLDCIILKPVNMSYAGKIESVSGGKTDSLEIKLDNCTLRIDSVMKNVIRVWADKRSEFDRKYESFSAVNEKIDPQTLVLTENEEYFSVSAGEITLRLYKEPFCIAYYKGDRLLTKTDLCGIGFSADGELICRNVKQENEHFWGLGETPISFDRLNKKTALWGNDIVASRADSAVPENAAAGRWYMNNPVFTSSNGYTVLFDNPSRTVFDFGVDSKESYYFASLNPYPAGELIYYFICGDSVKEQMTSLNKIIGESFFAPLWGYGNMQSHWGYTQADIERVSREYREKNIPLDLIIADIEWYEHFCTPTKWNKENFPDPEKMKKHLEKLNLRFGVIDDPNITASCEDYKIGDKHGYFVKDNEGNTLNVHWPWGWQSGLTDFFNPEAREWWKSLHKMMIDYGAEFFWMDMNEPANYNSGWYFHNEKNKAHGTIADCKNVFAQMQQRTMYELMTKDGKRSLMLTRSGYTGTHRYAAPWTGDIDSDYKAIRQQLSLGLGLSMSGYMYWTFDIGGSAGGHTDEEFKRWIELGAFMPLTRYHSTAKLEQKEPYTHGAEDIARKYINLRYRLMPYFYSLSADSIIGIGIESENGGSGLPLVRPMLMEFENDENTFGLDSQFMSGQSFLVAPVTDEKTEKAVYLPKGYVWYDYNDTKSVFKGNDDFVTCNAPIDTLPVFVKEGSVIPMHDVVQYVGEKEVSNIYLDVFPTVKNGKYSFVYYEDDGKTFDYKNGCYATTRYEGETELLSNGVTKHTVRINAREGGFKDIAERDYILQFHVLDSELVSAEVNGKSAENCHFDKAAGVVYVKTRDTAEEINVSVTVK